MHSPFVTNAIRVSYTVMCYTMFRVCVQRVVQVDVRVVVRSGLFAIA
jgi:hypothetical protein